MFSWDRTSEWLSECAYLNVNPTLCKPASTAVHHASIQYSCRRRRSSQQIYWWFEICVHIYVTIIILLYYLITTIDKHLFRLLIDSAFSLGASNTVAASTLDTRTSKVSVGGTLTRNQKHKHSTILQIKPSSSRRKMKDVHKKRKAALKDGDGDAVPAKKKPAPVATAKKNIKNEDSSTSQSKTATRSAAKNAKDADNNGFEALSLRDIHDRIKELANQVPEIPSEGFYKEGAAPDATSPVIGEPPDNLDKALIKTWASRLQVVLEELGLLLCCVSTATYRWGTDRSGASDQNLTLLNDELNSTQDQIASRVTPRLRNVLTPVVDLVVEKTITTKIKKRSKEDENGGSAEAGDDEGEVVEVKQNVFSRHLEDPDFVHLCYEILARNAPMMRLVVMTNFDKMLRCITDYLAAQNNESQHHREFAY